MEEEECKDSENDLRYKVCTVDIIATEIMIWTTLVITNQMKSKGTLCEVWLKLTMKLNMIINST